MKNENFSVEGRGILGLGEENFFFDEVVGHPGFHVC